MGKPKKRTYEQTLRRVRKLKRKVEELGPMAGFNSGEWDQVWEAVHLCRNVEETLRRYQHQQDPLSLKIALDKVEAAHTYITMTASGKRKGNPARSHRTFL